MNHKHLVLWALVLMLAIGLGLALRRRAAELAVRPSESNGLFDRQSPSFSVPTSRLRDPQSVSGTPPGRLGGIRIVAPPTHAKPGLAARLGMNGPARPQEILTSGRRTFRWLENVAAVPETKTGALEVIERRGDYVFVRVETDTDLPPGSFPVVFEPRTGSLLMVTGKLSVHLKSAAASAALSQEYSMELLRTIARLNTATYQSNQPSLAKLSELLGALRKDERVVKADLEVLGETRTAQ